MNMTYKEVEKERYPMKNKIFFCFLFSPFFVVSGGAFDLYQKKLKKDLDSWECNCCSIIIVGISGLIEQICFHWWTLYHFMEFK